MTTISGNTPCIPSARYPNLRFKLEQCNPTGSYKDRFIERELSLLPKDRRFVVATSSGNTGASLAAFAARAGIRAVIVASPEAPAGKLIQMRAHGAQIVLIPGFTADPAVTTDVFNVLTNSGHPLIVSAFRYCPQGMQGVEIIAHELPDAQNVFAPVGGGGLYAALVQGFQGKVKVHAVQPEGCATVVNPNWRYGDPSTTTISGLSVPTDIDATLARQRLAECGGQAISVTDAQVHQAQQILLSQEGIYCEPAGATAFAGYLASEMQNEPAVCLITGHGFKDPASIEAAAGRHPAQNMTAGQLQELLRHAQ
ncbi:serine/threonine dehydratase [Bryobacterales bacterium F-183]|nr:serine/threonine dehydratase [Bryobacterales bacterium F-183]